MTIQIDRAEIKHFLRAYSGTRLASTSARRVMVTEDVYNVKGSSPDPKIKGKSWRKLLKSYGVDKDCYVTNHLAPNGQENSHPNFNVGGHVTLNDDGRVKRGEDSYLMPLCSWHNSKGRDDKNFEHTEIEMLLLEGFLEHDLPVTFLARFVSNDENSRLIYETEEGWDHVEMPEDLLETFAIDTKIARGPIPISDLDAPSMFKLKSKKEGSERYFTIEDISPDLLTD